MGMLTELPDGSLAMEDPEDVIKITLDPDVVIFQFLSSLILFCLKQSITSIPSFSKSPMGFFQMEQLLLPKEKQMMTEHFIYTRSSNHLPLRQKNDHERDLKQKMSNILYFYHALFLYHFRIIFLHMRNSTRTTLF
jgi:hypothetical protein